MLNALQEALASLPSTECVRWTGRIDRDGYGRLGRELAHRLTYAAVVGTIPDGLTIDHLCRVRDCINPAHMEPVTRAENTRRGTALSVVNAAKEVCDYGHPFTAENTYSIKTGGRRCRACAARHAREYRARLKEAC